MSKSTLVTTTTMRVVLCGGFIALSSSSNHLLPFRWHCPQYLIRVMFHSLGVIPMHIHSSGSNSRWHSDHALETLNGCGRLIVSKLCVPVCVNTTGFLVSVSPFLFWCRLDLCGDVCSNESTRADLSKREGRGALVQLLHARHVRPVLSLHAHHHLPAAGALPVSCMLLCSFN